MISFVDCQFDFSIPSASYIFTSDCNFTHVTTHNLDMLNSGMCLGNTIVNSQTSNNESSSIVLPLILVLMVLIFMVAIFLWYGDGDLENLCDKYKDGYTQKVPEFDLGLADIQENNN